MAGKEKHFEEFQELRARVDSLASAVFLISSGALTLSISVLINLEKDVELGIKQEVESSWYALFFTIVLFLFLKVNMSTQSFLRAFLSTNTFNVFVFWSNVLGWMLGVIGLICFVYGMFSLIKAGSGIVFS